MELTGRLSNILSYIRNKKRASVSELAKQFYASESSIRRDLAVLEKSGCVARYYGGAAYIGTADAYDARIKMSSGQKERIAERAAAFVEDGQTVFLDSSSTASFLIEPLARFNGLNIVTNCLDTAVKATRLTGADVYIAGGMVRSPSFSVVGSFTSEFFKDFHADIAFFSCTSYRAAYGCFESSKAEVPPKKTIVSNADKSVLLVDSSKLEAPAAFASVGNSEIGWMITDKGISEEEREAVTKKNVRLIVVD